jgi:predicted nucleic acid-binding Zn ribbon protein
LEIALFGVISDEELLSERLLKIESEMALLELNSAQNSTKSENKHHEERRITELKQEREMMREANLRRENRRRNYSMINPLIQGASQRLLRMM